ncbi:hypothetical protein ACFCZ1_07535 [Streptomyces sp. NPDC056224]|uniref:hypothetical protein n=1 Tax=Streptomyces sp. NPDC056224 TaxID=3345750 RepID=UPI0035DF48F8
MGVTRFRLLGGRRVFAGPVRTLSCHEDNALLRELVHAPGEGAVLAAAARCAPPSSATSSPAPPSATAGPA